MPASLAPPPAARADDLRDPAVQAYYVDSVIGSLIGGPGLDGTFLDSIDWWATSACEQWPCTPAETADLTLATLTTLDATLTAAAAADKVISVSTHTSLTSHRDFFLQQAGILARHRAHAIAFFEFFAAAEADLQTLIYVTQTLGLAAQVHVQTRTLAPDWLELAVFLLGAGEGSYFSCSKPWNLDSFDVFPEYALPLGPPAGPAVRTSTPQPLAAWTLLPGQNLVYNLPPPPPWGPAPIPGTLAFLGYNSSSAEDCLARVRANASLTAMTWVGANDKEWSLTCWGRADAPPWQQCIDAQSGAAPCWAAAEAVCTSAVATPLVRQEVVWTRSFQKLRVTWAVGNASATLQAI